MSLTNNTQTVYIGEVRKNRRLSLPLAAHSPKGANIEMPHPPEGITGRSPKARLRFRPGSIGECLGEITDAGIVLGRRYTVANGRARPARVHGIVIRDISWLGLFPHARHAISERRLAGIEVRRASIPDLRHLSVRGGARARPRQDASGNEGRDPA